MDTEKDTEVPVPPPAESEAPVSIPVPPPSESEVPVSIPVPPSAEAPEEIPAPPPVEEKAPEEIPAAPPVEEKAPEEIPAAPPVEEKAPEEIPSAPPVEEKAPEEIPAAPPVEEKAPEEIPSAPPVEEKAPEEIPSAPPVEEKAPETLPVPPSIEENTPDEIPALPPVDEDVPGAIPVPPPVLPEQMDNMSAAVKKLPGKKINLKPVIASAAGVAVLGAGGMVTYDIVTALPDPLEPLIDEGFIDSSETDKLGDLIYRCYDGYLDKDINIGDFPIIGELLMHAKTKGYKIPVTVLEGLVAAGAKPDMATQVGMAERSVWTLAVELGDLEVMKTLARLGTPTESKYVLKAVENNNADLLRTFAEVGMDLNYRKNNSENTPLMEAVIGGKEAMVRLLIELKADLNLRKKTGSDSYASCVDIADSMGNENMLTLLLQAGAIPTGRVAERMVYDACESNSMETLSTLIETGVDVMSYVNKPPYGREHLCAIAIQNDNAEMLRFFLLMGVSPNTSVGTYGPMLCMAAKQEKKNCVQMLLDGGAEPLLHNKSNSNSIHLAQDTGNTEIEKLLLAALNPAQRIGYNSELNKKYFDRNSVRTVIENGNKIYTGKMKPTEYNLAVGVINLFEKSGAALPYEDIEEILKLEGQKDGYIRSGNVEYTLAGWAAHRGDVQLLEVLNRAGVDMKAPGAKNGKSLVAIAAGMKKAEALKKLIGLGCDVNTADNTGLTPLCYAMDAESIKTLTDAGADINATFGNKQQTALMMAAAANNAELVQLLLEAGANPKLANSEGQTSSALAQAAGAQALATRLQAAETAESNPAEAFRNAGGGASTTSVSTKVAVDGDRSSLDPLITNMRNLRCRDADSKLYQKRLLTLLPLIRNGADVNVTLPETKGNTALHYSCAIGSLSITKWLLEHGANPGAVTDKGKTPLQCVGSDNREAIISALNAYSQGGSAPAEEPTITVVSRGSLTSEFVNSIVEKRLNLVTYNSPSSEKFGTVFANEVKELKSGKMVACDTLVAKAEQIAGEWPVRQLKIISVGTSGLKVEICYSMLYSKHSGEEVSAFNKTVLEVNNEGKVVGMQETLSTGKRPSLSSKFKKFNYKGTKTFSSSN